MLSLLAIDLVSKINADLMFCCQQCEYLVTYKQGLYVEKNVSAYDFLIYCLIDLYQCLGNAVAQL